MNAEERMRHDAAYAEARRDRELGRLIYDLRTEAGLTQAELAERMARPSPRFPGPRKTGAARPNSTRSSAWLRRWAEDCGSASPTARTIPP
ncbi:MAG: helix-turn-helix domain-containing protein [Egibacteraceae bacterium]